ncbi:hypothetical protein I553_3665 [Mycobacterium xenopi 4042]|uniref:Uncharacterized protein n=1 Tax=Mycobacterium xenopi 4042 TaxID=1299334 RepID=X7ZWW8_MYCXE|nr:hypothetical protein I553_3665 [Mycobacterium xenopi 4042]
MMMVRPRSVGSFLTSRPPGPGRTGRRRRGSRWRHHGSDHGGQQVSRHREITT